MKNAFGNYVVQKALKLAKDDNKKILISSLTQNIEKLCDKKLISKWKIIINNSIGNFASLCGPINSNNLMNNNNNNNNKNKYNPKHNNVSNNFYYNIVNSNNNNNNNNLNGSYSSNSSVHSTQFSSPQILPAHMFISNGRLAKSLHGSPLFFNNNNLYNTPLLQPINKYN